MRLTKEHLELAMSDHGGYSDKQFALIGVPSHPTPKGWRKAVVKNDYPDAVIAEFIALKNAHLTPSRRKHFAIAQEKRKARREAEGRALITIKNGVVVK